MSYEFSDESLGATIASPPAEAPQGSGDLPSSPNADALGGGCCEEAAAKEPEPMNEEPFQEIDEEGIVEPDTPDANQEMGDENHSATEEEMDKSNDFEREAVGLYEEGKYAECIEKYDEAIKLNGGSALLFANRGEAFTKLGKPNACIRDCNRALQIDPDSAVAYKFRGMAHRLLGHWEEAASDLCKACNIDYDEEADEWLEEVLEHLPPGSHYPVKIPTLTAETAYAMSRAAIFFGLMDVDVATEDDHAELIAYLQATARDEYDKLEQSKKDAWETTAHLGRTKGF